MKSSVKPRSEKLSAVSLMLSMSILVSSSSPMIAANCLKPLAVLSELLEVKMRLLGSPFELDRSSPKKMIRSKSAASSMLTLNVLVNMSPSVSFVSDGADRVTKGSSLLISGLAKSSLALVASLSITITDSAGVLV